LSEYPRWAGERAILKVDEEKPEFPPSDRVLRSWLDDAMRPYRYAQQWDARAADQIKEREAIERVQANNPQAHDVAPCGQIYRNYVEAVAANGGKPPIGAFEKIGRTVTYRG
jgi:hypothetical protein